MIVYVAIALALFVVVALLLLFGANGSDDGGVGNRLAPTTTQ